MLAMESAEHVVSCTLLCTIYLTVHRIIIYHKIIMIVGNKEITAHNFIHATDGLVHSLTDDTYGNKHV